jgi:DNA polymerase-1
MKVTEDEAKKHLETYMGMFPKVASWLNTAGRTAASRGFATTIGGRRRWFNIDGIKDDRRQMGAVERKGKNTPIQGTNADMTKLALYGLRQQLNRKKADARIVNTVHDEIVVECAAGEAAGVQALMEKVMRKAGEHYVKSVPMEVESAVRDYWGH